LPRPVNLAARRRKNRGTGYRPTAVTPWSAGLTVTFDGAVEGLIAFEPRGHNGFGYDPVFYYPPRARTFGELSRPEKDAVSHRGQALRGFRDYIDKAL
jgi:XTP/dITP diphosphohydrolase